MKLVITALATTLFLSATATNILTSSMASYLPTQALVTAALSLLVATPIPTPVFEKKPAGNYKNAQQRFQSQQSSKPRTRFGHRYGINQPKK